ncbi:MAG: DJ-1/PfpI family protein [Saprospiraceae bacterium]|nr:DJ-1/PfpI family protein [Saprospiraceae bacterium]
MDKKSSRTADHILSVCNGAFWLTSAGLLDDKEATTTAGMISHLNMFSPTTKPVYNQRFVEAGKVVTAGGLSAGIDGALHIVSKVHGVGRAQEVANNMEYHWQQGEGYVRTQLADFPFSSALDFNPPLWNRQTLQYKGSNTEWVAEYKVPRQETLAEFYEQFVNAAGSSGWEKVKEQQQNGFQSLWLKTDFAGRKWRCEAIFKNTNEKGVIHFKLHNILI